MTSSDTKQSELDSERTCKITFHYEKRRALASGVLDTASNTFLLLIAVRAFNAEPTLKSIIAGASSIGFLASPFVLLVVERLRLSITVAGARLSYLAAFLFLLSALFSSFTFSVLFSAIAIAAISCTVPLLTQMYQNNYPAVGRGKLFSRTFMIRIAAAIGFAAVAGWALTDRIYYFPVLLMLFALSAGMSAHFLIQCPGAPLTHHPEIKFLRGFTYVRSDSVFRNTLICWMLMGFANLMMLPLRVEFLANPRYGMNLSVNEIALLVSVIPNVARFVLSPLWGSLFDRVNFFALRIAINIGFALGIISFFTNGSWLGLLFGAVAFGISNAGGDIAWNLWVTKFAPPERVSDYMSVHSFFTGVRGFLAPFLAFHLLEIWPIHLIGWLSAFLIILACVMLLPEFGRSRRSQTTVKVSG